MSQTNRKTWSLVKCNQLLDTGGFWEGSWATSWQNISEDEQWHYSNHSQIQGYLFLSLFFFPCNKYRGVRCRDPPFIPLFKTKQNNPAFYLIPPFSQWWPLMTLSEFGAFCLNVFLSCSTHPPLELSLISIPLPFFSKNLDNY